MNHIDLLPNTTGHPAGLNCPAFNQKSNDMKNLYFTAMAQHLTGRTSATPSVGKTDTNQTKQSSWRLGAARLLMSLILLLVMQGMTWGQTSWFSPSSNPTNNSVTDPTFVYSSDNTRAQLNSSGDYADYGNFSISIPT
jgi:hypothetical protein